jgi:hypothetical protein
MPTALRLRLPFAVLVLCLSLGVAAFGQMESATLSGVINDPNGGVVPDVEVIVTRIETGTIVTTKTNGAGIYFFTSLMPGHYHLMVRKAGFKEIAIKEFQLYVQDKLEQNFSLEIGSVAETVTVNADDLHINTTDATVSTVVDRNFAENLPMNGRSFQTLIDLTPGIVVVPSTEADNGQFSVDGQRASSNYWMVDGVSANIGVGVTSSGGPGNALGGALGSFSAQGGTNSLVSVDALQEFRIQTSTYAPEFGRTPGAQISILTRSGTNQFHGTAFDYLRNDILDANNWFADSAGLPKPEERQNDFGGTVGGSILKDRTFFFFSYEGLRLRLPQTVLSTVPDVTARKNALPALQAFLNAYPLPNGVDTPASGFAQFNASFSNSSTLDAYSLRLDHKVVSNQLSVFGRYNYSPSENIQRGGGAAGSALSVVVPTRITTETGTVGLTWLVSPTTSDDLRINYSSVRANSFAFLDNFGGAVPLNGLPFPGGFTAQNSNFGFIILSLTDANLNVGVNGKNFQHQINIVNSFSAQEKTHALKFGVDFRRPTAGASGRLYTQAPFFNDVPSAENGNLIFGLIASGRSARVSFANLGVFAQDTWRVAPRLTLTYGLRWDIDFAPSSNPAIPAVTGYNLNDLSSLVIAPPGTPAFHTDFAGVAPRIGVAYQFSPSEKWQSVVRGGFGIFYDLADQEIGNIIGSAAYPFGAVIQPTVGTFPFDPLTAQPPPITIPGGGSGTLFAFDPHLRLPDTLEWNVAFEQALGQQQTVSATYIGSAGKRLIQTAAITPPNPNFQTAVLIGNSATSDYEALQIQFKKKLSHGFQALASEAWSHSIDTGSAGSFGNFANLIVPGGSHNANRGPSDFDIRDAFSAGITYDLPAPRTNRVLKSVIRGWSVQSIVQARSAPPVNVFNQLFFEVLNGQTEVRPDLFQGQPLYLHGPQYPGGKAFNPAAFKNPPTNPAGCDPRIDFPCNPARQGNLGRNALRGFGATQWDFGVHREFPIREAVKLQFRAELFNILNHPNFAQPIADLSQPRFGRSTQMLGQSLDQASGSGSFGALYQLGGPRSIQLALKLDF